MRIAFVVDQFPSLSQTFILRQITGLLERGHAVDIFAFSSTTDLTMHEDVTKYSLLKHTYYFPCSNQGRMFRLLRRLSLLAKNFGSSPVPVLKSLNLAKFGKRAALLQIFADIVPFLDKGPYDILHCQFGPIGELGLVLRDTGVFCGKIVTSFRGYDISSYVRDQGENTYDDLFRRGDLFLCVSERIKANVMGLGCDERKIVVHRSGIDAQKFNPLRREPKTSGGTRVLTIARLIGKKGVEYGIEAVAKVLKRHPRVEYRVAGEGPLREGLQRLIEELNVGSHIKLLGWKSEKDIVELLEQSDILMAPSVTSNTGDQEGIPGVIMEAFAAGLPVVSTNHAGIPEVVKDGDSGFLVPERNGAALAEKLQILIERPELRYQMGQRGRKFVEEYYDLAMLNDRLVELYRQLLHGELPNVHTETVSSSHFVKPAA